MFYYHYYQSDCRNFIKDTVRWRLMCFLELFQQHREQIYIYLVSFAFCIMGRFLICHIYVCEDRLAVGQNWDTTSFSLNSNHRAAVDIHEVYQAFINMP